MTWNNTTEMQTKIRELEARIKALEEKEGQAFVGANNYST
jgi:hypothetical protein